MAGQDRSSQLLVLYIIYSYSKKKIRYTLLLMKTYYLVFINTKSGPPVNLYMIYNDNIVQGLYLLLLQMKHDIIINFK